MGRALPAENRMLTVEDLRVFQGPIEAVHGVSFSVSASAVPLIAWIHGTSGFGTLFKILAVAAFVIFVAVLFLPNRKALDLLRSETHATAAD